MYTYSWLLHVAFWRKKWMPRIILLQKWMTMLLLMDIHFVYRFLGNDSYFYSRCYVLENMILKSLVHYFSSTTYMKKVPKKKRQIFCQKATCQTFSSQPNRVAVTLLDFCMIGDVSTKIKNRLSWKLKNLLFQSLPIIL